MSPLFDLTCAQCAHSFESILKSKEDLAGESCPKCEGTELQLEMSMFGGYSIKGNNSASQRPKNAGSFKKGKS